MGDKTTISWTDKTFNPWWGCVEVSPACVHCYARTFSERPIHALEGGGKGALAVWGQDAPRRTWFGPDHWQQPHAWNRAAKRAGVRTRVFCASMADVFEDRRELDPLRVRLFETIMATPDLDWQLLTKRTGLVLAILARCLDLCPSAKTGVGAWLWTWLDGVPPANVWMGSTAEDQRRYDERADALIKIPARIRFLSMEPLLEAVDLTTVLGHAVCHCGDGVRGHSIGENMIPHVVSPMRSPIDWILVGLESGDERRDPGVEVIANIVEQCDDHGIVAHVKQDCARSPGRQGRIPDALWQRKGFPILTTSALDFDGVAP